MLSVKIRLNESKSFNVIIPRSQIRGALIEILIYEVYEYLNDFRLDRLQDITLVDAGAHVGIYTIKAAPHVRKVIAIEPHAFNCALLKKNVQSNNLSNVVLVNAAIWSEGGEDAELLVSSDSASHKLSILSKAGSPPDGSKIPVKTISLKDVLELASSRIGLLKMDIEGAERDVLVKADPDVFKAIDKLVVELHPGVYGAFGVREIVNKLLCNGFKVQMIKPLHQFTNQQAVNLLPSSSLEGYYSLKIWALLSHFVRKLLRKESSRILFAWK